MIICERIIISHSAFLNEIFLYCETKRAAKNRAFFKMAGYLYETQEEKNVMPLLGIMVTGTEHPLFTINSWLQTWIVA